MSFKHFCDKNGYKAESRKEPRQSEFRAAKKAWFEQQNEIDKLQNKIDKFKNAFHAL